MIPFARERIILDFLQQNRSSTVAELAAIAEVSTSTIRRDLERLEEQQLIQRTYGGALINEVEREDPLRDVALYRAEEKRTIAVRAAQMIPEGATVMLDIGTTALAVAAELVEKELTIVTASVPVFTLFAPDAKARIIMLGGRYNPDYECFGGSLTALGMSKYHVDHAFIGASGIALNGTIRDTTANQVEVKQTIIAHADQVTVVADHTKFPGRGIHAVEQLATVDSIITDQALPPELKEYCQNYDVKEVVA
ncbi:MAG: DeoR/GlpR family DNA-binding transcription regulator [Actinomycetaceae bacterium]|nr:DeoR/GlpR family DNA-binding transcription regulator [Actinomycetaceae bacterium]